MSRLLIVSILLLITACQTGPDQSDKKFYSYVNAQGELITVKTDDSDSSKSASSVPKSSGKGQPRGSRPLSRKPDNSQFSDGLQLQTLPLAGQTGRKGSQPPINSERYQTPKEATDKAQEKIDASEEDRFISYKGPDGRMITRPLDLPAEREAAARRRKAQAPASNPLPSQSRYKQTESRIPADCCRHLREQAPLLESGSNLTVHFGDEARDSVKLDPSRPARILKLGSGVRSLQFRSYVRNHGVLEPRILVLNSNGQPVLKVDSLFTKHYPETWARYGYMKGELKRRPDFAYVVLYLPYALRDQGSLIEDPEAPVGGGDFRRGLDGELVVKAHRGRPAGAR